MFSQLFTAIKTRLNEITDDQSIPVFKQIDYFNNQYSFEENYKLMKFPHVYVEFSEPVWSPLGKRVQQATINVTLHIGSRTLNPADVSHLELIGIINYWITGLSGTGFSSFSRIGTVADQDHDEVTVHRSTFKTVVKDRSGVRVYQAVEPGTLEIIPEVVDHV